MTLSCCVWAFSGPEAEILTQVAELGFRWIDIQPHMLTTKTTRAKAAALGLQIACVGASFGMPDGTALDSLEPARTAQALDYVQQALAHSADLGATAVYVVPGIDDDPVRLARFAESLATAADQAAALGLKLCVEHFPGRALPTAAGTLEFLSKINHPNLYLLFDIGHILISGEDPVAVIKSAGSRLGYVHLDDNDGQGDLHWSLLEGVLTQATLRQTFTALTDIGYAGTISLELNPALPDPAVALKQSRQVVLDLKNFS